MSEESVTAEIHKLIDEKLASGVVVHIDWIAAGIMQKKGEIEGENAELYGVCTHRQIVQIAKRAIGKYQPKHQTDLQLVMDGFEHLSKASPMTRGGDLVLVGCQTDARCACSSLLTSWASPRASKRL